MIYWQPGMTLDQLEEAVIKEALHFYENHKTKTSQSLGISPRTLDNKLALYADNRRKEVEEQSKKAGGANAVPAKPGMDSSSGFRLQQNAFSPEESAVPVREPEKVEEVLPAQDASIRAKSGNSRGTRG